MPETSSYICQPEGEPKVLIAGKKVYPPFNYEMIKSAKDIIPREDDLTIVTYPKCGTTWVQHICLQLLRDDYTPDVEKSKHKLQDLAKT